MKLWKRRTIIVLSILLFLILSPSIILYSSGYRLDFSNFILKKVGMIIIESKPKNINVVINNKLVAEKTPYKKSNLTPKDYFIKLEKENYQTWGKNLPVKSQTVTWITNTLLFLKEPLRDVYAQENNIIESIISPDQNYYSYIVKTEDGNHILKLLDLKSRNNVNIFDFNNYITNNLDSFTSNKLSNISWSNDSNKLLLNLNGKKITKHIVIDISDENNLIAIEKDDLLDINWDINDASFIYYIEKGDLQKLNINDQSIESTIAKNVSTYNLVSNSVIYAKSVENNSIKISNIYLINKNKTEEILNGEIDIIGISNEEIINVKAQEEDLYLYQTTNKNLYLSENENILKISEDVSHFEWSEKKHFMYNDSNTIWHYKIENNKDVYHPQYQLNEPVKLLKMKDKINFNTWHPGEEHILYSSKGSVNIIELDNRDAVNDFNILDDALIDSNNKIYFTDDGNSLYYIQNSNNKAFLTEATFYTK